MELLQLIRDRIEAPLFGDCDPAHPWLVFGLLAILSFAWVRVLHYME